MKHMLSVLLSLFTINGFAQIGFGIEAGLNYSDYSVQLSGVDKATEPKWGMRLGALADFAITDNFYFQPGIYYVSNGYRHNLSKGYEQYDLRTIEIPLNIEYKIGILGTDRIFVGLGPYIAYNREGFYTINNKPIYSKRALRMGNDATDDARHLDYGAGINAGYQVTQGVFLRVRAQIGFADLMPTGYANSSIKNFGGCISAGYMFYRRDKSGKMIINRKLNKTNKIN